MNSKTLVQSCIFIFTVGSVLLVNIPATVFIAPWVGLAAQPFWFYESWKTKQWGIFATAVCITISWTLGLML